MTPIEYSCLSANTPAKLSIKVNELISKGWVPWGSASTAVEPRRKRFTQAMVKYNNNPVPPDGESIDGVFSLEDDVSYERKAIFQVVIANNGQHYRFDYADSLVYLHTGGFENVETSEDELRADCNDEDTVEAVRVRYTIKELNPDNIIMNIVRITESGDDNRDLTIPRGMIVSSFFCGTNPG